MSAAKAHALPADWGAPQDNALRDCLNARGVPEYGSIARLSDRLGIASTALIARLHRLRAGHVAAPPQDPAPKAKHGPRHAYATPVLPAVPFEEMERCLSPQCRAIVRLMHALGRPVTTQELGEALDCTPVSIVNGFRNNAQRMAERGWCVCRHYGTKNHHCPPVYWLSDEGAR